MTTVVAVETKRKQIEFLKKKGIKIKKINTMIDVVDHTPLLEEKIQKGWPACVIHSKNDFKKLKKQKKVEVSSPLESKNGAIAGNLLQLFCDGKSHSIAIVGDSVQETEEMKKIGVRVLQKHLTKGK